MRHLSLSRDGRRFTLTIDDTLPLKAAACAIKGARAEGVSDGLAVYSYDALPDTCQALLQTFNPSVSKRAQHTVDALADQQRQLDDAMRFKEGDTELTIDPLLRTVPMRQQVQALNFCAARALAGAGGSALLMEQGTGKSLVAIGLGNWLWEQGTIGWALVLCPNSVKGTWAAEDGELLKHSSCARVRALRGTRPKRLAALRHHLERHQKDPKGGLLWVVTNYDQFAVDTRKRAAPADLFKEYMDALRGAPPALVVFDESSLVKNHLALRSKACLEMAPLFAHRLLLTGTPLTRSPLDVWAQFQLLGEGCLGFNTYLAFQRAYAVKERVVPDNPQLKGWVEITSYKNLPDLERRVAKLSYRARAKDCLDLPPVVVKRVPVELSAAQGKALRQLKSDMVAELDDGRLVDGRNILVRYGKMGEVIGGFVKALRPDGTWDKGVVAFDPNPKLDALADYLDTVLGEDPDRKAVVFCHHVAEVKAVVARCKPWGAVPFYGEVPEWQRDEHRQRFTKEPGCRVFVAQYQCGSMGLNLTAADTLMFYSLTFNYGDFAQAQKRVHRKGQEHGAVREVYLLGLLPPTRQGYKPARTLDHVVLQALKEKKDLADVVTGDAAREMLEAL